MKLRLKTSKPKPPYGLYDIKDKTWLGDAAGPKSFTDWELCKVAAAVASEQLERTVLGPPDHHNGYMNHMKLPYRIRPASLPRTKFKFKDEIPTRMGPLAALQNIEGFCEVKT